MSVTNRDVLLQRFGFAGAEARMQEVAENLNLGGVRNAHYHLAKTLKELDRCMKLRCRY